jgi:ABC-type sugar transport system substrate-binding protein
MRACILNPANDEDPFFGRMARFAAVAARSLEVELEVIECGAAAQAAETEQMTRIARELAARPVRPHYAIVSNTRFTALATIPTLASAGIKTFLITEGLFFAERRELGDPGGKHPNWIGELLPDDEEAGRHLGSIVIDAARAHGKVAADGKVHVVGLNGTQTIASVMRYKGLKDLCAAREDVVLHDVLPALWSRSEAQRITRDLLQRFPETTAIWAANDSMALGAAEVADELGRKPGTDLFVGGIDWAPFAFEKVEEGVFTASLGGHFLDGAWALTMLHDHHQGQALDRPRSRSSWAAATAENLASYRKLYDEKRWRNIDFTRFSRVKNPELKAYDFSVESALSQV